MSSIVKIRMPESSYRMRLVSEGLSLKPGDRCLVKLDYGWDVGIVQEVGKNRADTVQEEVGSAPLLKVLRLIESVDDDIQLQENRKLELKALKTFKHSVSMEKTRVKILSIRFSYNRERLFIRYAAAVPLDLRRFIGQLQRDFDTQVDIAQAGARDEAATIGCVGQCGRNACCHAWFQEFPTVHARMARIQNIARTPTALQGTCGKLKCCLHYEYDHYYNSSLAMPKVGSLVRVGGESSSEGMVIGRELLAGKVRVRINDEKMVSVNVDDLEVLQEAVTHEEKEGWSEDSITERSES